MCPAQDPTTLDTALHAAAARGYSDAVSAIFSLRVHSGIVHARNAEGNTPLHAAIARGSVAILRLLLARSGEAGVDVRDAAGNSLLHCALHAGRSDLVVELLRSGADVFSRNARGNTPLHIAAGAYAAAVQ